MPLHVSSTVVLIIRRSKLYYTASGIFTLCRWPSGAHVERGLCTGRQKAGESSGKLPQELAQDAVCQSHTGHMNGLWFLPVRPLRLNTNE